MMKKDNIYFGLVLGIIVPFVLYFLIFFLDKWLGINHTADGRTVLRETTLQLLVVCGNLLLVRYYGSILKLDQTSRGIMVSIFALGLLIVGLNFGDWVLS